MIMADKISELRKRHGWTQEEFAHQVGVSRQAISKWEQAQSVPDLKHLEKMSRLLGVSIDFLINDKSDMSDLATVQDDGLAEGDTAQRIVSLEQARDFLTYKDGASFKLALGVSFCILASVPLNILTIMSELPQASLSVDLANLLGILLMSAFVIPAVALFMIVGLNGKQFEFMKEDSFETAYGVRGIAQEYKAQLQPKFITYVVIGITLCCIAGTLLMASDFLQQVWGPQSRLLTGVAIALIALAVYLFVFIGVRWGAVRLLLQEDDWSPENRRKNQHIASIAGIYWLSVTALYLAYSLITNDWERSWIIWPVGAVVWGIVCIVITNKSSD